jgi:hypothetical protein
VQKPEPRPAAPNPNQRLHQVIENKRETTNPNWKLLPDIVPNSRVSLIYSSAYGIDGAEKFQFQPKCTNFVTNSVYPQ